MNKTTINILSLALTLFMGSEVMAAVSIVECEDAQGDRIFSKTCPAGYKLVGEKKISTAKGSSGEEEGVVNYEKVTATMYLIKEGCAACEDAKGYLNSLGVNVNEVYIEDDLEQQNKLNELAGELRVPFTLIGDAMLKGFSESKFEEAATAEATR
jgi:glutaredoxin